MKVVKAGSSCYGLTGTIEEIDWSVGQILQALKKHGVDEDTLVIFTSDNGPWKLNRGRGGSEISSKSSWPKSSRLQLMIS